MENKSSKGAEPSTKQIPTIQLQSVTKSSISVLAIVALVLVLLPILMLVLYFFGVAGIILMFFTVFMQLWFIFIPQVVIMLAIPIVMDIIALHRIKKFGQKGREIAIAGLIIAGIEVVLVIWYLLKILARF